jgi:cytosine/adenosine deaminase-related metal-dependent hydrolase
VLFRSNDDALLDAWIFAAAANPIRSVWAAGRPVVRDGRHIGRDAVEAAFRRVMVDLAEA